MRAELVKSLVPDFVHFDRETESIHTAVLSFNHKTFRDMK